jgi:hypothetical protein
MNKDLSENNSKEDVLQESKNVSPSNNQRASTVENKVSFNKLNS